MPVKLLAKLQMRTRPSQAQDFSPDNVPIIFRCAQLVTRLVLRTDNLNLFVNGPLGYRKNNARAIPNLKHLENDCAMAHVVTLSGPVPALTQQGCAVGFQLAARSLKHQLPKVYQWW